MSRLVFSQGSFWARESGLGVLHAPRVKLKANAETMVAESFMPLPITGIQIK
jgi:hypothetical protein